MGWGGVGGLPGGVGCVPWAAWGVSGAAWGMSSGLCGGVSRGCRGCPPGRRHTCGAVRVRTGMPFLVPAAGPGSQAPVCPSGRSSPDPQVPSPPCTARVVVATWELGAQAACRGHCWASLRLPWAGGAASRVHPALPPGSLGPSPTWCPARLPGAWSCPPTLPSVLQTPVTGPAPHRRQWRAGPPTTQGPAGRPRPRAGGELTGTIATEQARGGTMGPVRSRTPPPRLPPQPHPCPVTFLSSLSVGWVLPPSPTHGRRKC